MSDSPLAPHRPLRKFEPTFARASAYLHCDRVGVGGNTLSAKDNCSAAALLSAHHINLVREPPS